MSQKQKPRDRSPEGVALVLEAYTKQLGALRQENHDLKVEVNKLRLALLRESGYRIPHTELEQFKQN